MMKKLILALVVLLLAVVGTVTADTADDLFAWNAVYLPFEEAASPLVDLNPNSVNATCLNCPAFQQAGILNYSLHFDGANDELKEVANTVVNTSTNDFTVNFWVKLDILNADMNIYGNWVDALGYSQFAFNDPSDQLSWTVVWQGAGNSMSVTTANNGIADNNWHMITLIRTGATTAEIWVDAVNKTNSVVVNGVPGAINEDQQFIGSVGDGGNEIDGFMDEFSFYTEALNATHLAYLNNSGAPTALQQYPFGLNVAPAIVNATYNMSSATQNETAWRTDQTFPIPTLDTTPTVRFDTDINANCRMTTTDQNWTVMGAANDCSTTGATSHVCSLAAALALNASESYHQLYIGCTDAANATMSPASTSGSLNVSLLTQLEVGLLDLGFNVGDNNTNEREEFYIFANWTNADNDPVNTSFGNCTYSADFILEIATNQTGANSSVCGAGCTFTNYTSVFSFDSDDVVNTDVYEFRLCHSGVVERDYTVSTNCSGEVLVFNSSTIVPCSLGSTNVSIRSGNCSASADVALSLWSDAINVAQSLTMVDTYSAIVRSVNDTDELMDYNVSNGLWLSDVHTYIDHGNHDVDVNCTFDDGGASQSSDLTIVVANAPPVVTLNLISDWINGIQVFADGITVKWPLVNTLNITSLCTDDDADQEWFSLYNSTGGLVYTESPHAVGAGFDLHELTQSNFTVVNDNYVARFDCNDTQSASSTINKTFTTENLPPVATWLNGSSVNAITEPFLINWTCVDPELETGVSYLFIDAPNLSITPNQTGGTGYNFSLAEGTYNFTVICEDSFQNSSQDDLSVTFNNQCALNITSPCDGCRYQDNTIVGSYGCSNAVNITSCAYAINDYVQVAISDCSNFTFTAERGWNEYTVIIDSIAGQINTTINFWAKSQDDSVFQYPVLWAMVLVMLFGFAMGRKMGVFYLVGGLAGLVVGFQLVAFSVTLGIVFGIGSLLISMFLVVKG